MDPSKITITMLQKSDYYKGFLELLSQLTHCDIRKISYDDFTNRLAELPSQVYVLKSATTGQILATASLLIEKKFIHELGKVAHIEDVVVDKEWRGKGIGKTLIDHLIGMAHLQNCYKIILDCSEENIGFYSKNGFEKKGVQMAIYFPE